MTLEKITTSIQELWQDYLFLTKEMAKFLSKDDFDFFIDLLEQRERLQAMIDAAPHSKEFILSSAGQLIFHDIRGANNIIRHQLQSMRNNVNRQREVSIAYNGMATFLGGRIYG